MQDQTRRMYSIVKIITEIISKFRKKFLYCENEGTVSSIMARIFRKIKLMIKISKILLGVSSGDAVSRIS